ncbi:tetratricopeptide repeat protein [Oscillochloris sp. ZM17-4]|uniref:adenylate/guanylate cyclase domain-containing protein n=1 Tax=Oscillochloris sp. ZM17-4 TaxID=2866714 RepID=UPI001C72D6A8|nr:adenylate/guanylate cyclase domain-containing protein [Oscillochloris sp. ZM17-4]MBX0329518.1 tetratricopeptide repeat protein [Oscillochloris sp. ZM17-4]
MSSTPQATALETLQRLLDPELLAQVSGSEPKEAALAAAVAQLVNEITALASFLPEPTLIQQLNAPAPGVVSGAFWEGSLLFADLSGFTALSGTLSRLGKQGAEEISHIINTLFGVLVAEIHVHGGILLKFGGDALTAFFDVTTLGNDHAAHACRAALAMQECMAQFSALTTRVGVFRLRVRIGVHSGQVFAAHVGDRSHIELVVTGEEINYVALAQEIAEPGEVVISAVTQALISNAVVEVRQAGFFQLLALHSSPQSPIHSLASPLIENLANNARRSGTPGLFALAERIAALDPYLPFTMPRRFLLATERMDGEFRPVTTLFIHFWPFSAMLPFLSHDPLMAAKALNAYYQPAQAVIQQFGGIVNKVDMYTQGDKLMALFGAPFAHEDDPERAVHAALRLRDTLDQANAEIGELLPDSQLRLRQRIGINTGVVFAGLVGSTARHEYTVMGQAVNLAARLMSKAGENAVVLSPATRRAAEQRFLLRELPAVLLKGIEQPVALAEAVRPLTDEQVAHWPSNNPQDIVGRVNELEQMASAGRTALAGSGRIIALIGEAGIGKTCLIDETLRRLTVPDGNPASQKQPYRLLRVASESYNQTASFNTLRQLLRPILTRQPDTLSPDLMTEQVYARVGELTPELARFTPLLGEILGLPISETALTAALNAEQRRERARELIAALLIAIAQRQPQVIILDDLHWIDASSLDLLSATFEHLMTAPLLILLAYRPELALDQAWCDRAHCLTLDIGVLSPDEGHVLIQQVLDGVPPPELEELLLTRSHGNPYFIEEFLRGLRDGGALSRTEDGWRLTMPASVINIPDSIEGVITARLDRLEEQILATLQVAAVIGQRFAYPILIDLVSRADELAQQLDQLTQATLIAPEQLHPVLNYLFRHSLIRDVAYDSLLFVRRRELHQRIAQIIEAAGGAHDDDQLSLLARHHLLAENWPQAFDYHVRAGRLAQRRFANREAITLFSEALKLMDHHTSDIVQGMGSSIDDLVNEVRERLGWLHGLLGNYETALLHYQTALTALPDSELTQQLRLHHHIARIHEQRADFETAFAWIGKAEALPMASIHPAMVRCLLLGAGMHARQGRYQQALDLTKRALEAAEAHSNRHDQAQALKLLGNTWINMGENNRARDMLERAVTLYRSINDLKNLADALNDLATLYHELGTVEAARATYEEAIDLAQTVGDVYSEAMVTNNLGDLFKLIGQYDAAVEQFERSLRQFTKLGSQYGIAVLQLNLGATLLARGDLALAGAYLDRADDLLMAQGAEDVRPELERHRAELAMRQGDLASARAVAEQALATAQRLEAHGEEGLTRRVYAQILAADGDHSAAWLELERSLLLLRATDSVYEICRALLVQADLAPVIGDFARGQAALLEAIPQLEAIGARRDLDNAVLIRTQHGYRVAPQDGVESEN